MQRLIWLFLLLLVFYTSNHRLLQLPDEPFHIFGALKSVALATLLKLQKYFRAKKYELFCQGLE